MNSVDATERFGTAAFSSEVMHETIKLDTVRRDVVDARLWFAMVPRTFQRQIFAIIEARWAAFGGRLLATDEQLAAVIGDLHEHILKEVTTTIADITDAQIHELVSLARDHERRRALGVDFATAMQICEYASIALGGKVAVTGLAYDTRTKRSETLAESGLESFLVRTAREGRRVALAAIYNQLGARLGDLL